MTNRILEEFRKSAIPDRLALANAEWVKGDEAIQIMAEQAIAKVQKVNSYVTKPAARILEKYQFAAAGGWLAYGCTTNGRDMGTVPYFKPAQPRKELKDGRLKLVKYETAQGYEALPILPWVDPEAAQAIYQRYNVEPLENETFWQVVWRCNLPIAITEGLKKALALIAHGTPALALRGIGCWHKKGSSTLHESIRHFATPGRSIYITLDQDEKAITQIQVRRQILRLGGILAEQGCKIFVPIWDRQIGKGIDDALFAQKEQAQDWIDRLLTEAPSLNDYKRLGRLAAALQAIEELNKLSYPIEQETSGEYLPQLPELQPSMIHVLLAAMNSGKTTRIGADWVRWARQKGWNVLVLTPLNALGEQTAKDWDIPHIHSFGTSASEQQAFWSMVSSSHGVVMCPNSLHRLPDWFWSRPTLLIFDEANQTSEDLTEGNTLGSRWAEILERLSAACNHAIETGAIILSEDGLPDRAVKFVEKLLSNPVSVRVFRHNKVATPWDCTVMSGQASGFRARMLQAVARGERLLAVTSSQREAKRLERALAKRFSHRRVVRIDSETNQQGKFNAFFEIPDCWLQSEQPDVLILSPSAKSGISIEGGISAENAYFSSVWGYFPALATDTHMQLLGRYRPPVSRRIFVPPFILAGSDEALLNPRAIRRRLNRNLRAFAAVYGIGNLLDAEGDRAETFSRIEAAALEYLAAAKAVSGSQKSIAHDALVKRLEAAGHRVRCEQIGKDGETSELWKTVQEEIWREDAQAIAGAKVELHHTLEWAYKTLDSLEVSLETRILAHKVIWCEEFPGVDFDDAEECYEALCFDYGSMRRGVLLQARAENLDAAKTSDRAAIEAILTSKIRAIHRLPKSYAKAALIAGTGILNLLDEQAYSNTDSRALAIKESALYFANEIQYWLRLHINPEQTPVEICNKLVKKFGLKAKEDGRPGQRGERRDRLWVISASDSTVRYRLLEAARHKLSSSVSMICKDWNLKDQQIMDTTGTKVSTPLYKWKGRLGEWQIIERSDSVAKVISLASWKSGDHTILDAPVDELEAIDVN